MTSPARLGISDALRDSMARLSGIAADVRLGTTDKAHEALDRLKLEPDRLLEIAHRLANAIQIENAQQAEQDDDEEKIP